MEGHLQTDPIHLRTLDLQQHTISQTELKQKLFNIIETGRDFLFDISDSLVDLLNKNNLEIQTLTVKAIAELSKCETKRNTFAKSEIIRPILNILQSQTPPTNVELVKQCCRALGNLCCDCDEGRTVILQLEGVSILRDVLQSTINNDKGHLEELKHLICKIILNLIIGGPEMSTEVVKCGMLDLFEVILRIEVGKVEMNDDMVHTALLVLSVINEHSLDIVFSPQINSLVLNVLKETTNVEISEVCLDHLHMQVEHDSVKTLLATESGVHLLCSRLEIWLARHEASDNDIDEAELDVKRKACDLIVCILLGDDAMRVLFGEGKGEIYLSMLRWLQTTDYSMVTTAALAVGNFARDDAHCIIMMQDSTFNILLNLFDIYFQVHCEMNIDPAKYTYIDEPTVIKIQQALLSAIRNLCVPEQNKREATKSDRTLKILLKALPEIKDSNIAYKLLGTLRMLVDGQDITAREVLSSGAKTIALWGRADRPAPAAEAPRLLAWSLKALSNCEDVGGLIRVEGIVSCLISMLVSPHSVMQGEAIQSLKILASHILDADPDDDPEQMQYYYIAQLLESELSKHIVVLLEGNSAKMTLEIAAHLRDLLDFTSKRDHILMSFKNDKLDESLHKFLAARTDLPDDIKLPLKDLADFILEQKKHE